jgi:hypothetical protein
MLFLENPFFFQALLVQAWGCSIFISSALKSRILGIYYSDSFES